MTHIKRWFMCRNSDTGEVTGSAIHPDEWREGQVGIVVTGGRHGPSTYVMAASYEDALFAASAILPHRAPSLADTFRLTAGQCDYPDALTREVMLCLVPLAVPTTATTASVSVSLFHLTRVVDINRPLTTLGQVFQALAGLVDLGVVDGGIPHWHLDARIDLAPLPRRRSSGAHIVDGQEISQTFRRLDIEDSRHHAEGSEAA